MRENVLETKMSFDRMYRYEIVLRDDGLFQIWIEKKLVDDDLGAENYDWSDILDCCRLTDTIESTIIIADEQLANLTGKI